MEHPHDSSDGDVDRVIDTNGTGYYMQRRIDGDPVFTDLDVRRFNLFMARNQVHPRRHLYRVFRC